MFCRPAEIMVSLWNFILKYCVITGSYNHSLLCSVLPEPWKSPSPSWLGSVGHLRNSELICAALVTSTMHSDTEETCWEQNLYHEKQSEKLSFSAAWDEGLSILHTQKRVYIHTLSLSLEKSVYLLKTTQLSSGVFLTRTLYTYKKDKTSHTHHESWLWQHV